MLGNTDMQKEVMKWVLDHIEYYCPMDEDAEEIMADFASNMYLEEWERASGKCIEIFHMLGDNFWRIYMDRRMAGKFFPGIWMHIRLKA